MDIYHGTGTENFTSIENDGYIREDLLSLQ